ncbi:two-component system response regulator RpaA [Gramella sp. Hel_I_59]|uniref:response regulator n=1 Tax=Gramella sp. Hel_I_59 TaxID=1249978 RepID=UPI0011549077|nr:response regulator [Gramella sp. Hel_I_59]TQI69279.1 two-component system response regulator RpaA [Gramella sp. Hel_I_59]
MASKQKILVIDDDPGICDMMQLVLEFNGHEVAVSQKPEEAEAIILQENVNLVILDMLMSGVNGTDICKRIRRNIDPEIAKVPILMMSALHDSNIKCKRAGANDFLSKPFDVNELILKVEELRKK